jgi:hypothetical protein
MYHLPRPPPFSGPPKRATMVYAELECLCIDVKEGASTPPPEKAYHLTLLRSEREGGGVNNSDKKQCRQTAAAEARVAR